MPTFGLTWGSWSTLMNAVSVAANTFLPSATIIDSGGVVATEVSAEVIYGASIQNEVLLVIMRETDTGVFQTGGTAEEPYAVSLPRSSSVTLRATPLNLLSDQVGRFKVGIRNGASNDTITVTVKFRQAVGTITP